VRYSRPGRLLAAWLQWIAEDYPQNILIRMIQDGLLEIAQGPEEFGFARLANLLRAVPIGFRADRYVPQLDEQIAALERKLDTDQALDEDGEVDAGRPARVRRQLAGMKVLREMTGRLLQPSGGSFAEPVATLRAAACLLEGLARCVNELDNLARSRLLEDIAEMADLLEAAQDQAVLDPWEYLSSLAGNLRVGGSGPRPGCLHCAHLLSGGHSGRANTFIVGLDDQRFPGAGLQDPILLDGERAALSADLPTASRGLRMQLEAFARLLARLRGKVTLSYSSRDLVEDREAFPSPVLLSSFRILSGNRQGDQADLAAWLGPPASFVPADPEGAIDPAEWWLWRTCGDKAVEAPLQLVAEEFPHLGRGMLAADKRRSDEFTEFDGRVEGIDAEQNPASPNGPPLSPSALETAGRCPLAYFFKYVLRIKPPEDPVVDPTCWLDPATFGALLHEVFCIFMRELVATGKLPPNYKRDRRRLYAILSEQVDEYKQLIPPPSEWACRRQRRELEQAVHIFLSEEERHCVDRWPVYMEASIGLPASEDGTPLDSTEPVPLELGGDTTIRIRGRMDRVDRIGAPDARTFAIWDYKTGSSWRFRQDPPFWQGRILQHALYLYMATERLRQVDPKATVAEVGYFFPGLRGRGERVTYTPQDLDAGLAILQRLCQAIARGAFLATDDSETDCAWCDYVDICGDTGAVARDAERKLQSGDELLEPLSELRGYDGQE
jgi:ATP-dependent helicase/nuclease subunit B